MPRIINPSDGSAMMLAIQDAYGTPVRTHAARTGGNAGFIQKAFPIRRLDVDGDAEITESDLLTASGATPPDEIGQVWARGVFDVRLLVEDFIHMLYGILNPTSVPTSTQLNEQNVAASVPTFTGGRLSFAANAGFSRLTQVVGGEAVGLFPSRLKITKTGGTGATKATVKGYRQLGRPDADRYYQQEVVDFASDATEATTTKFWSKINSVEFPTQGRPTGISALEWVPDAYMTIITFGTSNAIFNGWTALFSRGRSPARVQDLVPRTMTINADASGMNAVFDCFGVQFQDYRLADSDEEKYDTDLTTLLGSNFPDAATRTYPGWGGAFQFGSDIVKYESLEFVVDQRLDFGQGVDGSRFRRGLERQGQRRVTIRPVTQALAPDDADDMTPRWEEKFLTEARESLKLVAYAFDANGRGSRLQVDSPSSQLNVYPRFAIEGQGVANRPLSFLAQKQGATPELTIRVISQNEFSL